MPPVNLLIKPASSNCNLRCDYCFYHSLAENRAMKSYGIMSFDVLETLVKRAYEHAEHYCCFAFQGGEPTLAGLDFFRQFAKLQKELKPIGLRVQNAIQTNGMVIDDEWAAYFAENDFLVGLSLDGPKDLHDHYRRNPQGRGTFSRVMRAAQIMEKHKVAFNILAVVNDLTIRHPRRIYNFFRRQGFRYLQFIPCLEPLGPENLPFAIKAADYGDFLVELFDLWYRDLFTDDPTSIRYFDNLVQMAMGYPPECCSMMGRCQPQCVLEADGGVYPCDFYVIDEWYMGNIQEMSLEELKASPAARRFVEVSIRLPEKCRDCEYFALCRGGCRRQREPLSSDEPRLDYMCPAYLKLFEHAAERIYEVAAMVRRYGRVPVERSS